MERFIFPRGNCFVVVRHGWLIMAESDDLGPAFFSLCKQRDCRPVLTVWCRDCKILIIRDFPWMIIKNRNLFWRFQNVTERSDIFKDYWSATSEIFLIEKMMSWKIEANYCALVSKYFIHHRKSQCYGK